LHFQAEALLLQEAFYANCADRFRGVTITPQSSLTSPELVVGHTRTEEEYKS